MGLIELQLKLKSVSVASAIHRMAFEKNLATAISFERKK